MARRRRREASIPPVAVGERYLQWRYGWLGRMLLMVEPDTVAAGTHARIAERKRALDRRGGPIAPCLAELEGFIAEQGLAEAAERFVGARMRDRERNGRDDLSDQHAAYVGEPR